MAPTRSSSTWRTPSRPSTRPTRGPWWADSVYPHLNDEAGLREQAEFARALGFLGKSAIHPRQLPVLHEVSPSEQELLWARHVITAFDAADGTACQLPDGEFIDIPVARRARDLLDLAATVSARDSD